MKIPGIFFLWLSGYNVNQVANDKYKKSRMLCFMEKLEFEYIEID